MDGKIKKCSKEQGYLNQDTPYIETKIDNLVRRPILHKSTESLTSVG